jgi:hypothetical protein
LRELYPLPEDEEEDPEFLAQADQEGQEDDGGQVDDGDQVEPSAESPEEPVTAAGER